MVPAGKAPASLEVSAALAHFKHVISAYLKQSDVAHVEAAFHFAEAAHNGQFRRSGEPYIFHPLAVASILAEWHLDTQALIAALLHDVMEDTEVTKQEIINQFGNTTAELVDGVSKLDKIEFQSQEDAQAENFRKMLLAMARDVRVILIKLADRLHNMRTLDAMRPDKRRWIARETLEIYAPIANRLGLNNLYQELHELSFAHLYPLRYRVLAKAIKAARGNRREVLSKILKAIETRLPETGIDAKVMGREKHLYSIYQKMQEKNLSFSQVLDIYGFRVLVKDVPSCYLTLGVLHNLFNPVPGKFKDYLAIPKANGYQSLHTTLIGPYGTPIEVQIRTPEMHNLAETGVASHWLYKTGEGNSLSELQQKTQKWLQSLLDLQSTSGNPAEFLEHVKIDLFPDEVYVFTPKGKIIVLPRGSTAVDFAYAVHTDIGNCCVACRINYELMPLRTELKNGDQVEIISTAHAAPNPTWLSYVKTGKARAQIRHFLKLMQSEESILLGERLLARALKPFNLSLNQITDALWDKFLRGCGAQSKKQVLADIGLGKCLAEIVGRRFAAAQEPTEGRLPDIKQDAILISGTEGITVQLAKCCCPIPDDPIVAFLRKGQGLIVHLHDCQQISKIRGEHDKWVDVEWAADSDRTFEVKIKVIAKNVRGVLAKVASEIARSGSNVESVGMDEDNDAYTTIYFTLQVSHRVHLARIMRAIRHIPEVVRIFRVSK